MYLEESDFVNCGHAVFRHTIKARDVYLEESDFVNYGHAVFRHTIKAKETCTWKSQTL